MRRKRFQRGSLTTRKRNGKKYWLAQWREEGGHRTKELGLCSKITRLAAESLLQEILKPINQGAEAQGQAEHNLRAICGERLHPGMLTQVEGFNGRYRGSPDQIPLDRGVQRRIAAKRHAGDASGFPRRKSEERRSQRRGSSPVSVKGYFPARPCRRPSRRDSCASSSGCGPG